VVPVARRREEYREAFSALLGRRLLRFALLVFIVLLLLAAARGWLGPANPRGDVALLILIDAAVGAAVWGVAWYVTIFATANRMYATHLRITGSIYTFDEGGMQYASSAGTSYAPWSALASYKETPKLFLLSYPNRRFQLVPKRQLEPADVDRLRELLAVHLKRAN
jgi:hypothetical protein